MKYCITGGRQLKGEVVVNGAKNAILPILAASLLTKEKCRIGNIPQLRDVDMMSNILEHLGAKVYSESKDRSVIDCGGINTTSLSEQLMRMLRASNLVMGPLLSRFGEVKMAFPGGCNIGSRPMDLHLKAFEKMGAKINERHGFIFAKALKLTGAEVHLDFPSVGATENIMMAATLAKGNTIIRNAAREPEIVDLQNFLNGMGAKVIGAGTDTIIIKGVDTLGSVDHIVIPDRIEAGTYMVAGAITQGDITIRNVIPEHVEPTISKLQEMGYKITSGPNELKVSSGNSGVKTVDIKTLPYPGFPTDMQAQLMALLSVTPGTSIITETIFENRFKHVDELRRMGANIRVEGRAAVIKGVEELTGAVVEATDLRAGAALILAGLKAQGETIIDKAQYITRGYADIENKLTKLGADFKVI